MELVIELGGVVQRIALSHELLSQVAENLNISVYLGFFGHPSEVPVKKG